MAALGGSIQEIGPDAHRRIRKVLAWSLVACVVLASPAVMAQRFRVANPNSGNTVAVGTLDGSDITLTNRYTGNAWARGTRADSSLSVTNPYTGNTVGEGTIDGNAIRITDPYTGNTLAEGTIDDDYALCSLVTLASNLSQVVSPDSPC